MVTNESEYSKKQLRAVMLNRKAARKNFFDFVQAVRPGNAVKWFHRDIALKLQLLQERKIKKLMIFVPPQHGKSELVSRIFPAYVLGKDPKENVIITSYSDTNAKNFSRATQLIIDSKKYMAIFPDTVLPKSKIADDTGAGYIRTAAHFETIEHRGSLKAVGVGGTLTGNPASVAIIDDPFKDRKEANSEVTRQSVWEWYTDVFETRLHNDSVQVLVMTRWHEDDLAGRILKRDPGEWTIVRYPALKEDNKNPDDPRQIGEALWPERHEAEKFYKAKVANPTTYSSLYQQRPGAAEGNKFKRRHFRYIALPVLLEFLKGKRYQNDIFIDGAYTKNTNNDPSAIMACVYCEEFLFILYSFSAHLELPELVEMVQKVLRMPGANVLNRNLAVRVEPKASGLSLVQTLRKAKVNAIPLKATTADKVERAENSLPFAEALRIVLVEDTWNAGFVEQCATFPNAPHDDEVDNLTAAIDFYDNSPRSNKAG